MDATNADIWLTLAVVVVLLVVLVREIVNPAAAILGAVVTLVVIGVLDPAEAFLGFANPATITVAGLFVIARALQEHSGLQRGLAYLLGDGTAHRRSLLRLVAPLAGGSAVIANTPLVAAIAPMVREWAERHGVPASRYLMPVSFAAILGGTITTIGTSVTLLVSGLVQRQTGSGFSFFEVTPVGIPVAIVGGVVLVLLAPSLVPDRQTLEQQVGAHERDYSFHLEVQVDGAVDGRTVREADLRNLVEAYLARIDREGQIIAPVPPDQRLQGGDELTFVGRGAAVKDLVRRPGLQHGEQAQISHLTEDHRGLYEAVVARGGPLVHRTLKEVSFRGRYEAAVLAIHRAGERLDQKLGTVELEAGDALLLQADADFASRWRDRGDFAVIVPLDEDERPASGRRWLVLAVLTGMIGLAATGAVPIMTAVLLACGVLVATGTVSFFGAKDAIDLDVILIIGGAIGLGAAVEQSGIATAVGDGIMAVGDSAGAIGALAAILFGTMILTEIITNAAAAALMVPIALDVAGRVDADPIAFAVAVAIAASSSYLTPIGYQTNTIVYGLGGYRFTDYIRLGLPMNLAVAAAALVAIPVVWF